MKEISVGYEKSERDYAYDLLKRFDVYGSGDLGGCVREVLTQLREKDARIDELLRSNSETENERRMWKSRAESLRKLLDAALVELRIDFEDVLYDGKQKSETFISSVRAGLTALQIIRQVADRVDKLEADAWCKAVDVARTFVKECDVPLGDYAQPLGAPTDGDNPKSAFVRLWRDKFKAALG